MAEGIIDAVKSRVQARAFRLVSRIVAYVSAAIALVFILAGGFVWLAREESLVFACLVFAAAFFIIALAGLIVATVFERRIQRHRADPSQSIMALLRNPTVAALGLQAVGRMRRAPGLVLGAALAAGLALSVLGHRTNPEQT